VHELRSPLAILQGVHYLLDRDHVANPSGRVGRSTRAPGATWSCLGRRFRA
jgi:hypothetical protein